MSMSFYDRFLAFLETDYPRTAARVAVKERFAPTLVSPRIVHLPVAVAAQARAIITAFFSLRQSPAWQELARQRRAGAESGYRGDFDPGNFSALMCFDFHLTTDGHLKLIEINTNASMALVTDVLYRFQQAPNPFCAASDTRDEIWAMFASEFTESGTGREFKNLVITDESPAEQRLYIEFLLYQELFERKGLNVRILDPRELAWRQNLGNLTADGEKLDFVYNRHTDFYFSHADTAALADAWASKAVCVSPNPHEYMLLADKERLEDLSALIASIPADNAPARAAELATRLGISPADAARVESALLESRDVRSFSDPDRLWAERKRFFFKPKRSYGGKAVYKGASMSRTLFEKQIIGNEYVAQEFVPAPTLRFAPDPDAGAPGGEFKYDLRFFAYRDRIQLAAARLYQGQTTNFQQPGSGMAVIRWDDEPTPP